MSSSLLFTPVSIGPMTVPNRFVMPPMGNNFAHTDGSLSERSLAYYAARAKGGFGLVTIEATVVDPTAKGGPRKPCLVSDATIGSFQRVVQACHAEGAKVSVQLQHAGPEGNPAITGYPLKAASAVPAAVGKAIPQAMTEDEIAVLAEQYGDAARRAEEAGPTRWSFTARMAICCTRFYPRAPTTARMRLAGAWRTACGSFKKL